MCAWEARIYEFDSNEWLQAIAKLYQIYYILYYTLYIHIFICTYTGRTKVMLLESCTANPFPLESFCQHDSGQFPPRKSFLVY